jgi:hypothetical protein
MRAFATWSLPTRSCWCTHSVHPRSPHAAPPAVQIFSAPGDVRDVLNTFDLIEI